MDFKICWLILSIMCGMAWGLDSMPIEKYQKHYVNNVMAMRNLPQQRIDAIYRIVDSESDDYYKIEQVKKLHLY